MFVARLEQGSHILEMSEEGTNTNAGPLGYLLGSGNQDAFLLQGNCRVDNRLPTALTAQTTAINYFYLRCF